MRVAMIALDQAWEDPSANLAACRQHVARARGLGAELVVFPELTLTGFTMNATRFAEDPSASPTIDAFAEMASEHSVHVAFGVALQGRQHPRNTLVIVDRDGREAARYAKVHPFTYAGEHDAYEAGEELVAARVSDVSFGLAVCYDLRFPGMFAALGPRCDALLVIANWPGRRILHWETLLRARAIESQCCVIGVNRTGVDGNGIEYPRSSLGVAADGTALKSVASDGVIDVVEFDAEAVRRYRESFPVLRDARAAVYAEYTGSPRVSE